MILAIDPGNEKSAWVILNDNLKPVKFGIYENDEMINWINEYLYNSDGKVCIEMIASYGMAVGKEVFETCVWIGRFIQESENNNETPNLIYRKEEKINLCGTMKANDSNIRQALIDRFGVVGTKNNKGWFYGVSKDVWSAIAVGITYADKVRV